jgi:hypothetical protein
MLLNATSAGLMRFSEQKMRFSKQKWLKKRINTAQDFLNQGCSAATSNAASSPK